MQQPEDKAALNSNIMVILIVFWVSQLSCKISIWWRLKGMLWDSWAMMGFARGTCDRSLDIGYLDSWQTNNMPWGIWAFCTTPLVSPDYRNDPNRGHPQKKNDKEWHLVKRWIISPKNTNRCIYSLRYKRAAWLWRLVWKQSDISPGLRQIHRFVPEAASLLLRIFLPVGSALSLVWTKRVRERKSYQFHDKIERHA